MKQNSQSTYKFGLITTSAFVIANMIGTGAFTSLGFLLLNTSNFITILLLWLLGGIIALCGALAYGELGAAMPRSGGEYHYLSQIYHPFVGFLSGWASLIVGFAAPIALACMAFSNYLYKMFPALPSPVVIAVLVLTFITLIHAYDVKAGGVIQRYFTLFKILIILAFIVCGFCLSDAQPDIAYSVSSFTWDEVFSTGFAVSLVWVYYSYSGWNASAYMASEIKNPQRVIPRSLCISTILVTVLYILLNAVFLFSTPVNAMKGEIEVALISAQHIFGVNFGNVMGLLIAILLLSSISSMAFLGPRVSQVMGEDTYILRALSYRSKKGTPYVAIWLQYAVSFLLIITDSFALVTRYTGITLSLFAMITVVGVFVHRKRFPHASRPYKTWGYPFVPLLFIVLILWSIVYLIFDDFAKVASGEQTTVWMTLMSLLTLFTGAVVYFLNKIVLKYKDKNTCI